MKALLKLGIKRQKGFLYYVNPQSSEVRRVSIKTKVDELVRKIDLDFDENKLYFLNTSGDIAAQPID
ncbi:MAG: hypothetical protein IT289_07910 [Oligoflexia bacterium]|nr:hypothetical protein [Oligoflexia bacterium]